MTTIEREYPENTRQQFLTYTVLDRSKIIKDRGDIYRLWVIDYMVIKRKIIHVFKLESVGCFPDFDW
jgi:hypothetical protein